MQILHANTNILMHYGLQKVCGSGGGIEGIQQVHHEAELRAKLAEQKYDLVIIDPRKEHGFELEQVFKIREESPDQAILIISDIKNEGLVLKLLEKGVQGYLTYECDGDELKHAIFAIYKGEKFYCNKVLDIVFNKHLYKKDEDDCNATSLTARETEIACLLAKGLTNKEVADKIFVSPHTVQTHRKNLMKKLGIRSASELTLYAVSTGLIEA